MSNRVLLCILDGWGISNDTKYNAVYSANTPNYDNFMKNMSHTTIHADGLNVGLPEGQMGNSEVGHLNIGAGRIVYQELTRINKAIAEGDFFKNEEFLNAINHVKKNNSSLHIYGLVSSGGVHSAMNHLEALIKMAADNGLSDVYVHAFLDGRDTPPESAETFLAEIEETLKKYNLPKIASIIGRYWAMDRDKRWERIEKAYNCLVLGEGNKADSSKEAILNSYKNGKTDEFVEPVNIGGKRISDNDAVIFFNYRPDRAREITRAIAFKDFDGFNRKKVLNNLYYVCMTQYDETFGLPVAFKPQKLVNILGEVLDANNIKQFRTAETEKYAHITFFFNGGVEEPNKLETRKLVASPKVATYDLKPEMSAYEVCDNVLEALDNKDYGFILVNFANPDMVGHTGVMEAAVKACSAVDECVGKIAEKALKNGVKMIITADHGNAEWMFNEQTNAPQTAHTTNIVPFIIVDSEKYNLKETGALCDIAPTILDLMGIKQPSEMTGHSMIKH
ncbi:TPA: 2,3-bisphosphoglycerate-independent phosphoglycerate mutase [Candidatus Galligastranaerophilus intestinigallinarum]|nr:2,3-bisphosphoglycerate-independent phosphoglycerate mutase [Candidatus Galligastranaerophilus intestinigallinarum]